MAQLVYLLINLAFLFNIGIRPRDIGFRLVIIVVADEIFHGVIGEKLLELAVKLSGQGFIMAHDQGRALDFFYDVRHREGFTAAGNPQESLSFITFINTVHQFLHRLRLVSGHFKIRYYFKLRHYYSETTVLLIV